MELLNLLKEYWAVLAGIITIIIAFANIKSQNSEQERRICKLESDMEKLNPVWVEIKERLAAIEAILKMLTTK